MQVRLLNRLYAKKRQQLCSANGAVATSAAGQPASVQPAGGGGGAAAAPPAQQLRQDERSLEELMAFIEQGSGGGTGGGQGGSGAKRKAKKASAATAAKAGSSSDGSGAKDGDCKGGGGGRGQAARRSPHADAQRKGDQQQPEAGCAGMLGQDACEGSSGSLTALPIEELFPEDGFDDEGAAAGLCPHTHHVHHALSALAQSHLGLMHPASCRMQCHARALHHQ